MKKVLFAITILVGFTSCFKQPATKLSNQKVVLPNGWSLSPAGSSLSLGDLPLNMAVSPDKKWLAVTNNGQSTQTLQLINVKSNTVAEDIVIAKSWYGLKFSADSKKLYASGGNDNMILQYNIDGSKLIKTDSFVLGRKMKDLISPAGFDIDETAQKLYVVTKENNALYIFNLADKKIIAKKSLPAEAFTCLLSADKSELFVSCWGCDKIISFNTKSNTEQYSIEVGDNPNELLLSKDGKRLFVSNANDNTVSVIDVRQRKVIETLNAALYPNAPSGSTTNGLALSEDGEKLFIANADNNCLAVFDVEEWGQSKSEGFIPTGWYPTSVKVAGSKIFVANGKGFSSLPNPLGPNPYRKKGVVLYQQGDTTHQIKEQYIGGLFKGTLSIVPMPTEKEMAFYSKQVYENSPYTKAKEQADDAEAGNPVPNKVGGASPIKYVFYIIKENRTYDQVLGDIPEGNGDTSLVLFGERITPNQHRLVKDYVLLDNFYVNAEVSADGHNWSMGAYATDYLEKTWPTNYGGRGGKYDAEGGRAIANNKGGFIWDHCKRHNVTFRTYGEFADDYKANIPVLEGNYCKTFTSWDMDVSDTIRFTQWKQDFDSLIAANALPQLTTLRFPNDHTEGLRRGSLSPNAYVAQNDLAVGMFIEHLSHSPVWKQSVVFMLEDDAQNGSDHVDAHRSTAYVIGPYVKRNFVDHTMYSTTSMIRTLELILGMPPMTQHDAGATSMWRCFTTTPDFTPYKCLPANIDIGEKNIALNKWQQLSDAYDFTKEDAAPDLEFTEVIWHAVKGVHVPFPGIRRAAFIKATQDDDD